MKQLKLRGADLAYALFAAQLSIGLVAAIIWWLANSARSGYAALFGASIAIAPGLFFALRLWSERAQLSSRAMGRALVAGELGKLVLTATLFLVAALTFGKQFVPLIMTYIACLSCYWLALKLNR